MHSVENSSRKVGRERPLGIPRHRWEGNIRMDLREIKMGVCVYTHTYIHTYVWPPRRVTSRPCTGSVILASLVRDPGLYTARGVEEIREVRKVRRDIVSRRRYRLLSQFA
jgi:hypothetical protein